MKVEFLFQSFRNCCTANKFVKQKFIWTDACELAFNKVKLLLQKSPVLKSSDYGKPFKLIIDSSDVGTGSVLVQEASDG